MFLISVFATFVSCSVCRERGVFLKKDVVLYTDTV